MQRTALGGSFGLVLSYPTFWKNSGFAKRKNQMEHDPFVANASARDLIRLIDAKIDSTQIEKRCAEVLQDMLDDQE